jgi:hypothetical protein
MGMTYQRMDVIERRMDGWQKRSNRMDVIERRMDGWQKRSNEMHL